MANALTCNVKGMEDVLKKLRALPGHMEKYEQDAVKDGAKVIETEMKNRAPEYKGAHRAILPGLLRNSINTVTNDKSTSMGATEFHAWIGPAAHLQYPLRYVVTHYKKLKGASKRLKHAKIVERAGMLVLQVARMMEHGTYNKPAHAFIRPALLYASSRVKDVMERRLKDGIDKASRGSVS